MGAPLSERFEKLKSTIERACSASGRNPKEIILLPVTKGWPIDTLKAGIAIDGFPMRFGENYLQEMKAKAAGLEDAPIEWHFLGQIQRRKLSQIAQIAHSIHSISRAEELESLAAAKKIPSLFLQVNISLEPQKGGCSADHLESLLATAAEAKLSAKIVGLMGVAKDLGNSSEREIRKEFSLLRQLRDKLLPNGLLSMGMTSDFKWGIAEGANVLRIGSAIFGRRPLSKN